MATNRDLLKEAIADAKAVKETAIANAKAALEEAFTPFLKEKLAQKINEMDEIEEEESEMYETEMAKAKSMKEDESVEEVSLDELLAELDEYAEVQPYDVDGDGDVDKDDVAKLSGMNEAKGEEKEEEMSIEDMDEDDLKSFIEDVIKDMVSAGELEAGHEGEEEEEEEMEMEPEEGEEEMETEEEELDENVDLDELLAELDEYAEMQPTDIGDMDGDGDVDAEDVKKMKEELGEAVDTIKSLQSELNEINLLNAKLLYTNKIFRNKSLTESQKIKVLTAFDKATTKKEVELVYETLQEGLKVSTVTKSTIKESLGSASKALGSATAKPIIENDAFARMRELAGLKNK
jgi:hypothetical protein